MNRYYENYPFVSQISQRFIDSRDAKRNPPAIRNYGSDGVDQKV